jgi:hypothetical protein
MLGLFGAAVMTNMSVGERHCVYGADYTGSAGVANTATDSIHVSLDVPGAARCAFQNSLSGQVFDGKLQVVEQIRLQPSTRNICNMMYSG